MKPKNMWDFACAHPIIFSMMVSTIVMGAVAIISDLTDTNDNEKIKEKEN